MNLTTASRRMYVARNEANENGAAGAPAVFVLETAGDFANKPTTALDLQKLDLFSPKATKLRADLIQNGIAFSFAGGSADDID